MPPSYVLHPTARLAGLLHNHRPKRSVMLATTIADDLNPLHRSCHCGCHSGSLILGIHALQQNNQQLATQGGRGRTLTRASMQALEETLAIADVEAFERAAKFIHGAQQRDLYGVGGSAQIARDVSHKFLRIGVRISVFDDAHMTAMSASLLGTEDLAIGFSHTGATSVVIETLQLARKNGARTIAVTNYINSPIAESADVVLCSTARGSPLLGENAAARVAQLNILDAIFVMVAQ